MITGFPRQLREKELELIGFVLPIESPGYHEYRNHIANMVVLAEGRRGKGNFVLGNEGDEADFSSPLASVIAYGVVETIVDPFTITVREFLGEQIDVEIVSSRGEEIPDHVEEKRRWTYSTWKPGLPSPATHASVREVRINESFVLAIAQQEKRLWLFDAATMMNHLIPITNFHNELMLRKGIRDPKIALNAKRFWDELTNYSDADLRVACVAYNKLKKKVELSIDEEVLEQGRLKGLLNTLLGTHGRREEHARSTLP